MADERTLAHRDALRMLEQQRLALEVERARARSVYDHVNFQLNELTDGLDRIHALAEQLSGSYLQPPKLRVSAIPEDVLHAIFEAVLDSTGHWSSEDDAVIQMRTRAPYVLASVCKRWRSAALNIGSLWSYIAIPGFAGGPSDKVGRVVKLVANVTLRLERSCSAPLDIVVAWSQEPEITVSHETVLALLSPHHSRWRRFKFVGPDKISVSEQVRRIFALPAPELEEVHISQPHVFRIASTAGPFNYFPERKRLRRFYSLHSDMLWTAPTPFGAITSLTFCVARMPLSAFRAVLEAAAPTLRVLEVVGGPMLTRSLLIDDTRLSPVTMPRLVSFTGRSGLEDILVAPLKITAPQLETLVLHECDVDALTKFFDFTCASVTSLEIEDGIEPGFRAASLRALTRVRELVLGDFDLSQVDILAALAQPLQAQPQSWMFPELRSITFANMENTPLQWTGLVQELVRQRNRAAAEERDGAPAKINLVRFVHCDNVNEDDRRSVELEVNAMDSF